MHIYSRKTLHVVCEKRQVFQCKRVVNNITLRDIDELRITSCHMSLKNKKELFYANGVDYEKVFKYYDYVKKLNDLYYQPILENNNIQQYQNSNLWHLILIYISILFN